MNTNMLFDVSDEEYYSHPAISNSDIKMYLQNGLDYFVHGKYLKDLEEVPDQNQFVFGSMFHCYLLEPEKFQSTYVIIKGKKPFSDQENSWCNEVLNGLNPYEATKKVYAFKSEKDLIKICNEKTYKFEEYLVSLKNAPANAIKISEEEYNVLKKMIMIYESYLLRTQDTKEISSLLYKEKEKCLPSDWFVYNEVVFIKEIYKDFDIKCKVDKLFVNHKERKFYIIDYKTTSSSSEFDFMYSINKYGYKYQAAHYYGIVSSYYPGYTGSFVIIACQKKFPYSVNIFNFVESFKSMQDARQHLEQVYAELHALLSEYLVYYEQDPYFSYVKEYDV